MSMYTDAVKAAAEALDKAEAAAMLADSRYLKIKGHCGQHGYSVTVNGVTVAVSTCDRNTGYQGTLIRGREMIHLGALKALDFERDQAHLYVKKCREYLALVVNQ